MAEAASPVMTSGPEIKSVRVESAPAAPKAPEPTPVAAGSQATGPEAATAIDNITSGDPSEGMHALANLQPENFMQPPAETAEAAAIVGTPAEGMNKDSRYTDIQDQLMQQWLKDHPGEDIFSEAAQNYRMGNLDGKDAPTLKSDTEKEFRGKYPDDAAGYDQKEITRIYEDPQEDPALRAADVAITQATNFDPQVSAYYRGDGKPEDYRETVRSAATRENVKGWDEFVKKYPDKAKAYAEKGNTNLQLAMDRAKRRQDAIDNPTIATPTETPAEPSTQPEASVDQTGSQQNTESQTNATAESSDANSAEKPQTLEEQLKIANERIARLESQKSPENAGLNAKDIAEILKLILQKEANEKDGKKNSMLETFINMLLIALGAFANTAEAVK